MADKSQLEKKVSVALLVAGLALMAGGAVLAFLGGAAGATAIFTAATVCLVFSFLPQFQRFKAFGLEGELRAKLAEADETITRLKAVATPIARVLYSTIAGMGRWNGLPRRQRQELMDSVEAELRQIGVTDPEIDAAKRDWHWYTIVDLALPIIRAMTEALFEEQGRRSQILAAKQSHDPLDPDYQLARQELNKAHEAKARADELIRLAKHSDTQTKLAEEIRRFIETCDVLSEDVRGNLLAANAEQLADLDHYARLKRHRRPDVWLNEPE